MPPRAEFLRKQSHFCSIVTKSDLYPSETKKSGHFQIRINMIYNKPSFISLFLYFLLVINLPLSHAQTKIRITGLVTDMENNPLAYAGVYVSGSTTGTSTNADGKYFLDLPAGKYTIVCRYLGFAKQEKTIQINQLPVTLNFVLQPATMRIEEVVVHGGIDPAYAIIKKAIQKRPFYKNQVNAYSCRLYVKGLMKMRDAPDKFLGKKMDYSEAGLDSTHSGIFFLSESISKISAAAPDHFKQEVISSRQSGGGLGFDFPIFINFYENNISLGSRQLTPRGYVSPIADNALHYYKYHFAGTFKEDGYTINKIRVIPKRKHEPLFRGYINIMDSSWRIHSLDLMATKEQQLQLIDSLDIRQIHAPITDSIWRIRNQSLQFRLNQFGFHLNGTFVNIYSDYNLHPHFPKDFFNTKVILRYDSLADKRNTHYWDSIRPVPLEAEELKNFQHKDSLALARKDSLRSTHYLDSIRREQKPPGIMDILWNGYRRKQYKPTGFEFYWSPLLRRISYNTVEGLVTKAEASFRSARPSGAYWRVNPTLRYGWSNHHFNASLQVLYSNKKQFGTFLELSGGKRVSQFNHDDPINPLANSLYTLLAKKNFMKIYENYFGHLGIGHQYINGFAWHTVLTYEDRYPLHNTTYFSLIKNKNKDFQPNHPYELAALPFVHHQALMAAIDLSYQPGQRYIQYPDAKIPVGSRAPVFGIGYTKGLPDILGSDVNYDKWYANIRDDINLKLKGTLKYKIQAGGFLNRKAVSIPDLKHFNGNQTFYNIKYMNSFQLAPYYEYSNDAPLYGALNLEYHLNGLLTNKIPLFNRLHWNLVVGSNAFYVNEKQNYIEAFAGLENIFKLFRLDLVTGYQSGDKTAFGIRIGLGGLLGGALQFR